jgi:predicted TIM-barrel fold metal-dependent hydrolase
MRKTGRIGELKYSPDEILPMRPSEYFARNCWVGVSFPSPSEAAARAGIGVDRFMWGSDYPHDEASIPNTLEALRGSLSDAPVSDLRAVL